MIQQKAQLLVSTKVLDKIKYLVTKFNPVEWSGVTFLKVNGDVEDPSNLKLEVVDFVLLDIGTAGYTEFDLTVPAMTKFLENHIEEYVMDNSIKTGIIHSHNQMSCFFSGTDTDTLLEKATEHSFFTSLIVNNRLDKIAKISYAGKLKTVQTFYNRLGNIMLPYSKEVEEDVVFVIECEVNFENDGCTDLELLDQINDAEEIKSKRVALQKEAAVLKPVKYGKNFFPQGGVALSDLDDEHYWNGEWVAPNQLSLFKDPKKSLETRVKESQMSLTEKCIKFAKKLLYIDYGGYETESVSMKETREMYMDSYGDTPIDVYLEEVGEALEDFFTHDFEKELRANTTPDSKNKLRKMFAVEFRNIFNVESEVERKILEMIDSYLKHALNPNPVTHGN